MNLDEINKKNEVLIKYLRTIINDYVIIAEFDTNNKNIKVITVQEQIGQRTILYSGKALNNYYSIDIFGKSIKEQKETANFISSLIGQNIVIDISNEKWQIMFKQWSNPQAIEYMDIRRVAYNIVLQCIINKIN